MLALVKKCGLCLPYIHESLQGNGDIIRAACEQILSPRGMQLYKALPEEWQCHRDISDTILRTGDLKIADLPSTVTSSKDFWLSIPDPPDHLVHVCLAFFHQDPELVAILSLTPFERYGATIELALLEAPELARVRPFWTAVIESTARTSTLHTLLRNHAAPGILRDRELMLLACKKDSRVYSVIDATLQGEKEIVSAMVECYDPCYSHDPTIFSSFPKGIQSMYPDLVVKAIRKTTRRVVEMGDIAEDLWTNLDVMKALIANNHYHRHHDVIPLNLPDKIKDNERFGLFVTRFCHEPADFELATSVALRSNKTFMMKAVERNPICLHAAVGGLAFDFDLSVMAFSQGIYSLSGLFGRRAHHSETIGTYGCASRFRVRRCRKGPRKGYCL